MTFADLFNSFLESSRERIKNPLIGSFFICFLIYNWRPIFFLLFSEHTVEDRIVIINNVYCDLLAILFPILFSIIYTLYLPILMIYIDKSLEPIKKDKIDKMFLIKDYNVSQRMILATKEFALKNIQTGNKDREDLLLTQENLEKEISNLRHELIDANEGNSKIIKGLNSQLGEMQESYKQSLEISNQEIKKLKLNNTKIAEDLSTINLTFQIYGRLKEIERRVLIEIRNQSIINSGKKGDVQYNLGAITNLINNELIVKDIVAGQFSLTMKGINLVSKMDDLGLHK